MKSLPTPRHAIIFPSISLFACTLTLLVPPLVRAGAGGGPPPDLKPKITVQPGDVTINQGQSFSLTATATGNPEPRYQWMKNGINVPGATLAKYTVANAQPADSGVYTVFANNRAGRQTSSAAVVLVVAVSPPSLTLQPSSQTLNQGQTAVLQIAALGTASPTYQWRKNGYAIPGATTSTLQLGNLRPSDAGSYDAYVTNTRGTVLSRAATLTVLIPYTPTTPPPSAVATAPTATPAEPTLVASSPTRILVQPKHANVIPGNSAAFTIIAAGENLAFQWKKNGVQLAGATVPAYAIARATANDMGFYSIAVSGAGGTIESEIAILTVASDSPSRLANLSTRGYVPVGGALTPGFAWRGTGPKNLLVRAVGPTLAQCGVGGSLADPRLEIIPAGAATALLNNDNWSTAGELPAFLAATAAAGAFALDAGSKDAAALITLQTDASRSHTMRLTSVNPAADGIVLAEIYDTDPASSPGRLAAVSSLGFAGAGDRALVPGFTIAGTAPKRLLIRAIGPGLAQFGVTDVLADPQISIHATGLRAAVASNDDWSGEPAFIAATSAAGAFTLAAGSKDAALIVSLPPGGYTVGVTGAGGATGNVLVEIYDLDP